MSDKQTFNIGLILIALGALVFLGNFGLFNGMPGIIGSMVLGIGGVLFSRVYFMNSSHIWALLVGFGFFAAAAAAIAGELAGAYFLAILGSGFALAYFQNKRHWWAVIPAGALATLAIIVGIETRLPFFDDLSGSILFLGIAATFAFLYFMPELNKRWALYPAIAAVILAFLSSSLSGSWVFPLLLIAGGVYLLKNKDSLRLTSRGASRKEQETPEEDLLVEEPLDSARASL